MSNHQTFFQQDVPQLLNKLTIEAQPEWGEMDVVKMLEHLRAGTELFMGKIKTELEVPEEKLPRYKAFLMSDKPFMQHAPKPKVYNSYEQKDELNFEKLKSDFLTALKKFDTVTRTEQDFCVFHPSFGLLNAEETRQLQFKHICHHFQQFGLLKR